MNTDSHLLLVPGSRPAGMWPQADQRWLHVPILKSSALTHLFSLPPPRCRALCNAGVEPLLHPQRAELRRKEHIAVVRPSSTPPSNSPGCSWIAPCTRQMQDPETQLKISNSPHSVQLKKRRMTFHHLFTSLVLLLHT